MEDPSTSFEDFVATCLKPVLPTRTYLRNKPCSRCHLGTNIRVSKPTCSHRICSTCLAEFEFRPGNGDPISCTACSTYWFTPHSGPPTAHESEACHYDSDILQLSKEINWSICQEAKADDFDYRYTTKDYAQNSNSGPSTDLYKLGDIASPSENSFSKHLSTESIVLTNDNLEQQAFQGRGRWKASGTSPTAAGGDIDLRTVQSLEMQRNEVPHSISSEDGGMEKRSAFESDAPENLPRISDVGEDLEPYATHDDAALCAREVSINTFPVYRIDTDTQRKRNEGSIWPALLLVAACFAFNLAAASIMGSLFGGNR